MSDEPDFSAAVMRPAQLKIRIRVGNVSRISITDGIDTVRATSSFADNKLADMRAALRADLEEFSKKVTRLNQPQENVVKALLLLKKRGRLILNDLFGSDDEKMRKAEELCRRACPNWKVPGWSASSLAPGMVEVAAGVTDGIPVEILPLFEYMDPSPDIEGDNYIARLAGSFLGFSAIVKRQLGSSPRFRSLDNQDGLPIRLFLNRRAPGAGPVEKYFRKSSFKCDVSWPDSSSPSNLTEFTEVLALHLWQPGANFAGQIRHSADQVLHFHCHCDTRAQPSGQHALILHTGTIWGERRVDLDSLRDALYRLRRQQPKGEQSGPLVFLNACGSVGLDPNGATSFPKLFLEKGMRFLGVIGTEASIPDEFARIFAKRFYDGVVEGVEIGTSLHNARWELLQICKNPLGVLYTLYAEPEICVKLSKEFLPASRSDARGAACTVSNL